MFASADAFKTPGAQNFAGSSACNIPIAIHEWGKIHARVIAKLSQPRAKPRQRYRELIREMEIWRHAIAGLAMAALSSLALFHILRKGSFRLRWARSRTTRQDNPFAYWTVVVLTALLILAAFAAGIAQFARALQP